MRETLLYGLKDGELLHISQVENGLKCNCKCPACGENLKAINKTKQIKKNGELRLRSFAHFDPDKKCEYANETALHYLAKQVLLKKNKINLPAITSFIQYGITREENGKFISKTDCIEFKKSGYYHFQKVELEKYLHDIKPDVILTIGGHKLYIEIKVTHGIDDIKLDKIRRLNISIIEIDLKEFDPLTIDETLLTNHLVHSIETKKWFNNSKQKFIDQQV